MSGRGERSSAPIDHTALLSVWPVAQQTAREQRRGRYLPASTAHPGKMLPELARSVIRAYSRPGELVLDPMCGIGTTSVEAIHLDRDAIGVELEPRWAAIAAGNALLAREQGALAYALCMQGDARRLGRGLLDELAGQVPLILTSPPYGPSLHGQVKAGHGRPVEKWDDRYSRNPRNLAHLPARAGRGARASFADALAEILAGCARMLAPAGRLVLTARPYRSRGQLVDLPGEITRLAEATGLTLAERRVALLCGLRDSELVSRASFFQLNHQRRRTVARMLLIAHEDVLVFMREPAQGAAPEGAER
jgi:SAM-dependent methyltransferase